MNYAISHTKAGKSSSLAQVGKVRSYRTGEQLAQSAILYNAGASASHSFIVAKLLDEDLLQWGIMFDTCALFVNQGYFFSLCTCCCLKFACKVNRF